MKRVFLIAVVPGVPKNYQNLRNCGWILSYKILIGDSQWRGLKLCNTLLGMMSHMPPLLLVWCGKHWLAEKKDTENHRFFEQSLLEFSWDKYQKEIGKTLQQCNTPPQQIRQSRQQYLCNRSLAAIKLHLLIGPVNIFWDGLENVCPRSEKWLNLCDF